MSKKRKVRLAPRYGHLVPVVYSPAKEIAKSFQLGLSTHSYNRDRSKGRKYYKTIIKIPMRNYARMCRHPYSTKVQRKVSKEGKKLDVVIGFGKNVIHVGHDIWRFTKD